VTIVAKMNSHDSIKHDHIIILRTSVITITHM